MMNLLQVKLILSNLQIERGFLLAMGSGLGIIWPVFFDTRTLVPSSRKRREILVGSLKTEEIQLFKIECEIINKIFWIVTPWSDQEA